MAVYRRTYKVLLFNKLRSNMIVGEYMGTIKVSDNDEYRAMQSLRRRPEMKIVRRVIERELAAARLAYEATASEDIRSNIHAHKALLAAMFDNEISTEV